MHWGDVVHFQTFITNEWLCIFFLTFTYISSLMLNVPNHLLQRIVSIGGIIENFDNLLSFTAIRILPSEVTRIHCQSLLEIAIIYRLSSLEFVTKGCWPSLIFRMNQMPKNVLAKIIFVKNNFVENIFQHKAFHVKTNDAMHRLIGFIPNLISSSNNVSQI